MCVACVCVFACLRGVCVCVCVCVNFSMTLCKRHRIPSSFSSYKKTLEKIQEKLRKAKTKRQDKKRKENVTKEKKQEEKSAQSTGIYDREKKKKKEIK